MKKLLFTALCDFYDLTNGVTLKVHAQMTGFKELGFEVTSATYDKEHTLIKNSQEEFRIPGKTKRRITLFKSIINYVSKHELDTIFIRYPHLDFSFMHMLKVLRNKAKRIILEIPSFPIEYPKQSLTSKYFHLMDILHRNRLKKFIDIILAVGQPVELFHGVKVITIPNGYMSNLQEIPTSYRHDPHQLDMICLSSFYETHGLDRLINGVKLFVQEGKDETNVCIHLIGDGPQKKFLMKSVKDFKLEEYVKFYPQMSHEQINTILPSMNMGCGPLALYRAKYEYASPLKTKDYFQMGLPFIYAYEEIGVSSDYPYVLQFPNDDSPIDISKVIQFYKSYQPDFERVIKDMKKYGIEHFDWKNILKLAL